VTAAKPGGPAGNPGGGVACPRLQLLLDEPTNHLSPALADELEDAFGASPGAIIVATHDRWLRARWRGTELRLGGAPG
jgi:macrolide transport system ATP-binding/permease protein